MNYRSENNSQNMNETKCGLRFFLFFLTKINKENINRSSSIAVTIVEPAVIPFHKLLFFKTRELALVPVPFARLNVSETLETLRNKEALELFGEKVKIGSKELDIGNPRPPRRKRSPKRLDGGHSAYFQETVEE